MSELWGHLYRFFSSALVEVRPGATLAIRSGFLPNQELGVAGYPFMVNLRKQT